MMGAFKIFALNNINPFVTVVAIMGTLSLSGCLDDKDLPDIPDSGYISIYNGAPNSPGLIITTDVKPVNDVPLKYSQALSYLGFYPGKRPFKFTEEYSVTTLLEKEFTVKVDSVYSMYILDSAGKLDAVMVDDDWEKPNADEAQVRLLNLSPDAGEVNVFMGESGDPIFESAAFRENSGFEKVDGDAYDVVVTATASGDTLLTAKGVNLAGNRVFTLVLKGYKNNTAPTNKLDLQLLTNYISY